MTWHVETRSAGDTLPILHVIACHEVWRRLTAHSREALVALAADPDTVVHQATLAALTRHGLVADGVVTHAGRIVVRFRPDQERAA